jgi:hypothetical protein
MKPTIGLLICNLAFVTAHAAPAIQESSPRANQFGLTRLVELEITHRIQRSERPTMIFPRGLVADRDAPIAVRIGERQAQEVDDQPKAGEFRILMDRSVLFSREDSGKEAKINIQTRRKKAVVIVYNPSDINYVPDLFHRALSEHLKGQGYQIADPADAEAASRVLGNDLIYNLVHRSDSWMSVARSLDARAMLVAHVRPTESTPSGAPQYAFLQGQVAFMDLDKGKWNSVQSMGGEPVGLFGSHKDARQRIADSLVKKLLDSYW